jgi:hypothetical protein
VSARRRGFALLLVLAATLVVLTAATLAVGTLLGTRRQLAASATDQHLIDGLAAGERLALAWLAANGERALLPPEGGALALPPARWRTATGDGRLAIHLYDACAAIPASCAGTMGSLRQALPPGWSTVAIADPPPEAQQEPADWLEAVALPDGLHRFPLPAPAPATVDWSAVGSVARGPDREAEVAPHGGLAALVSPHSHGAINLNTAPEGLLRQVFLQLGTGSIEGLVQRRRRGRLITAAPEVAEGAQRFRLVTVSRDWSALIAVEWNGARRSWWVVITGNPMEWRIVQRHDADR